MARTRKKTPAQPNAAGDRREPAAVSDAVRSRPDTRVDSAHVLARPPEEKTAGPQRPGSEPQQAAPATWPDETPAEIIQQVRTHAEQLAAYLRADQQTLDHREAQLNAREAELDARNRSERLWLTEQQQSLAEREDLLVARERELEANATEVARRSEEMHTIERELEGRSSQLAAAQFAVEQLDAPRKPSPSNVMGRGSQDHRSDQLLAELQGEVEVERRQLTAQRQEFDHRMTAERKALAERQQLVEVELREQREALDRRNEYLNQRQAAVDQFRAEVTGVHQETLQMRLIIEETWAQLSKAQFSQAPSTDTINQSLIDTRKRLAEQFQLQRSELAATKGQLEGLATRLTAQQERLTQQKRELQQWLASRQTEIEQHTTRLTAREQELRRSQAQLDQSEQQWHTERRQLKQEIRQLLAELARRERS